MNIIPADGIYRIMPAEIVYEKGLVVPYGDRFGNHETDCSAAHIVKMCQNRRPPNWAPFNEEEIEASYKAAGRHDGYTFNRLICQGWIVDRDGLYYITDRFVDLSYTHGLWNKA